MKWCFIIIIFNCKIDRRWVALLTKALLCSWIWLVRRRGLVFENSSSDDSADFYWNVKTQYTSNTPFIWTLFVCYVQMLGCSHEFMEVLFTYYLDRLCSAKVCIPGAFRVWKHICNLQEKTLKMLKWSQK